MIFTNLYNINEGDFMIRKKVSKAIIRRLPTYYRYLIELENEGVEGISSQNLSEITGFTASQIRQDFNNFGGFGQQGFGYNVSNLKTEIGKILGLDQVKKSVIVGAGNLGKTLARYKGFEVAGMDIVAIFDRNPENIGQEIDGISIQSVDELEAYLADNQVDVGIITIDPEGAQDLADIYMNHGIKGIWNFTSVDIDTEGHADVYVEDVRLTESFMNLSYYLGDYEVQS